MSVKRRKVDTGLINHFGDLMNEVKEENIKKVAKDIEIINSNQDKKEKNELITLNGNIIENLIDKKGLDAINKLNTDEETKQLLTIEYEKYLKFAATSGLWLGKYYQELFEKLSNMGVGNQYTSTYTDYITNVLNISVKTAKRYRDKYELFQSAKNLKVKTMIALLSHADVKILSDNKETILPYLEGEISIEELKNLLINNSIKNVEQKKLLQIDDFSFDFNNFQDKILTIGEKAANILSRKNMTDEEKLKASKIIKYIKEIEKLIEEK